MMLCKVSYQGQNKIIKLQQTDQLQDLILQVPKFFPNPANFELYYLDEDQDQISMTIEEDFEIFKEKKKPNYKLYLRKRNYLMSESQIKPAEHSRKTDYASPQKHSPHKIIEQSEEEPLIYESKVRQFSNRQFESEKGLFSKSRKRQQVHDINCSKCRANQIVGVRYQCPFCLGFNICEVCERQDDHMHSLVKVKKTSKEINYEELRNHLNLEFPDQEILSKEKQLQELRRKCNNLEKKSSQTNVNQQINRTHRSSSSYNKSNERQPYQQSFDYRMRQGRRKADQMRKQIDKKFNRQYLIPNEGYGSYYDSRVPLQLELQRRKRLLYPNLNFDRY